jgi:hypothetical protein
MHAKDIEQTVYILFLVRLQKMLTESFQFVKWEIRRKLQSYIKHSHKMTSGDVSSPAVQRSVWLLMDISLKGII